MRVGIDAIDVEILKALLKNPRTSFAEIAENCEMSYSAIRTKVKMLKKAGIITGAIMQVNPRYFGYNCIATLMIQTDSNGKTRVIDFLKKNPNIISFMETIGRFDILSVVALNSIDDLAYLKEQLTKHEFVEEVRENVWVDVTMMDHPENLVIEPFDGSSPPTKLSPEDENPLPTTPLSSVVNLGEKNHLEAFSKLDKIDLQILSLLTTNADTSFRKIAKQLDISPQSVMRRYKKLKRVSPYSSITVNLRKIGYEGTAFLFIKTYHSHYSSKVLEEMLRVPNVIVTHKYLGPIAIIAVVPFKNISELFKTHNIITKIAGVKQIELLVGKPFSKWPLNLFAPLISKTAPNHK